MITGGTSGIGLELGKALLERHNTVVLLGSDEKKLKALSQAGFRTIQCDLRDPETIDRAAVRVQNEYPDLNILFNNAGVQFNYRLHEDTVPYERIADEVSINLTGQLRLTQLLLPILLNAEKAFIVNTTSGLGAFPKADGLVYSASKAAMRNFTIGLRYALKDDPVKVLEFIPPVTDTAMTDGRAGVKMSADELVDRTLPQLQKERTILTVPKMRLFLWIAFLWPALANKLLNRQ